MLSRWEIKEKLYQLLDEVGTFEIDGDGRKNLLEIMDSIQLISFIVEIEECFSIEIPDEYLVSDFFGNEEHMVEIIEQLINDDLAKIDV